MTASDGVALTSAPILAAPPGPTAGPGGEGERAIELRLDARTQADWTILDVGGEVDLSTAPSLRDKLGELMEGGSRRILVNLGDVGFIDSSGLGVLVQAKKQLDEVGGQMALVAHDGPTLKVLAITGLDKVFRVHPSVEDALAS